MCRFFSLLSDAKGNYYYADDVLRKQFPREKHDSYSWLAKHFLKNGAEDNLNCYEFNPLTKVLVKDKLNTIDDSLSVERWCNEINWKQIVPELIVKPVVNPFKLKKQEPTEKDIENLKKWILIYGSACGSVEALVWKTVGGSVSSSSVEALVWYSVRDSIWESVGDSVWKSVKDSIWPSIGAYYLSFFDVKYEHDFSCLTNLWERGFVPSFDGKTWHLHSGEKAEIVY